MEPVVLIEVQMINETEAAYLFTPDTKRNAEWVAKSMINDMYETEKSGVFEIEIPEWLGIKSGWV